MPNIIKMVPVDLGLVTSRDPGVLTEGELVESANIEYEPASPTISPLNGRTSFGATSGSTNIVGLYHADFDGATNRLIARTTTEWQSAPAGETGTWATLQTGLAVATYGDGIHYLNDHFLFDGVANNRVLTSANTLIDHGLSDFDATINASATAGSGLTADSAYGIWITGYDSTNDIEGTFTIAATSTVTSVTPSGANLDILVSSPAAGDLDADANQYYVYVTAAAGAYPNGFRFGPTTVGTDTRISAEPGTAPNNISYDFVTVNGITFGRNGQPPRADAAEIFEESLVVIDSTDKQRIRYSVPDLPHYFPSVYFVGFETPFKDEGRALKAIGNHLLVFLKSQVWRVDYLPRASDSEFLPGRIKEPISLWHGCLSPRGPVSFEVFGGQELVAFPSYAGWMVTDGFRTDTLTDDLDWANTVSQNDLNTSQTINNAAKYRLELHYDDGSSRHKALHAYYHPTKLKEGGAFGKFTITGPHDVPGHGSAIGFLTTNELVSWTAATATAYIENRGNTDAASLVGNATTITARVTTPRFYWGSVGGEYRLDRVFIHHPSSSGSITVFNDLFRDSDREVINRQGITVSMRDSGATPVEINDSVQDWQMTVTGSGNWGAINYIAAEIDDQGRLESV